MIVNRSVPRSAIIPVLTYDDVAEASVWLRRAFGFKDGERQNSALDLAGHHWTFSQSIADVDPASWGAISTDLV